MNGQPERDIRGLYSILSDAKTMNGDTFPGDFNTFAKYIQRDDIRQGLYRKLHGRGIFGGSYEDFQNTFLNPYASETNQVEALRSKTFTLDPRKEMARQRALLDASRGEYNPYGTSEVSYNPDRRMRGTNIAPIDLVESGDTLPEIATSTGPKTTRTFWGGVVSGARGIHGGAQIAVADLLKGFGGNSDDEKEAIHLINQMEQDGTLSIERVHGVREKLLKELDSYTHNDILFSGDYSKKARQADALKLIEERMQRIGQDLSPEKRAVALDAMRSDLSEKGAGEDKENPFVRWKEDAKDYIRKSEVPSGGWAELGSATASVGGAIAGQAISMIPGAAPIGQAISWASIGAQTISSGGQAIMDMEDYAAEKGVYISPEDKATIALGYMATEFVGDALGGAVASKSISAIGKLSGGRIGQKLAVRSLAKGIAGNEGVRQSLSSMSEYAQKPLAIPLAKSAGRQIVRGAVTEGPGESLTTLAQNGALDRVWKSKEDQEAWADVARQAVKDGIYGAWAGALMGGFGAGIQSGQVARMHHKEGLTIVQDEKNNLYEVIGADQSSYLVLDRAGRQKMLPADQVVDAIHYTPQERKKSQKAYDEATEGLHPKEEEVLTENQKRAGAILSATEQQQSPIYRATHPEVAEEELNSPVALAGAKQALADVLEGQNEEVRARVDQMALVLRDGEADPTEELTKLFSDESLSDNDRQSILDVVTAQSRLSTIERSHQEAMAQMQSELTKEWSAKSVVGDETARGAVISATITDADGKPKQVYVTGGVRVVTNEDGTVELLPTDDDAPIYVYDESVDGDERGHIVQMDDLSSPQLVAEDYLDMVQASLDEAETAFRSEVQAAEEQLSQEQAPQNAPEDAGDTTDDFMQSLPRTREGEVDGLKLMSERPDDFIRYLGQLYGEDFVASLSLSKSGALDLKALTPEQTLRVNEAALGKSGAVEAARQRRSKVGVERSKLEAEVKSDLGNLEKRMALRKASEEYRLYDDYVRAAEEQARQELEAQKRSEEEALTPEERQRREEEKRQLAQEKKEREERIRLENERRRREREELERNAEGSTVREYTEDPPRQARARGARLVNGAVVYRQEPMEIEHYADAERAFSQRPGETRVPVKRTIVEAESLQASHKEGRMNPRHFIPEAQPKDRADNGLSSTAADRIASNIRPDEITGGITAYTGAPVVNGRGEVIQGNNRTDALQTMYDGEERHAKSAELYKEYLKAHASEYGMTAEQVDAMAHPVAVDVAEVSDSEAIRLGHRGQTDLESAGADTMNAQTVGEELNSDTDPQSGQSMLVSFFNRIFNRTGANGAELSAKMDNMLNRNAEEGLKFLLGNGYITDTQYKNAFETNSEGKRVVTAEAKTALKDVALYQLADVIGPRAMDIFYRLPASARNGLATFLYRDSQASFETSLAPDLGDALLVWDSLRQDPDFAGQTNFESAKIFILGKVSLFGRSELETNLGEASSLAKLLAASMQTQTEEQIADVLNQYYDLVGANETGAKTQSLMPTSQPTDTKAGAAEAVYGRVYEVPSGREKHYRFRRDVAEDFRARRDALADRITEERRKHAAAMDMARTFGIPPKLHEDMSTLPEEVRAGFDETHSVKGWFYKGDNAVHIYLPANVDADDVRATFLHEAVGHYGCRELLGEVGYNQVLDGIASKLGEEEVLRAMKEYCNGSQDLTDLGQVRIAMDEWIAHRAESGIAKKTVWESIKDFFRKVFGLSGKQIDQSAEMMADDLLRRSAENLEKRAERQQGVDSEGSTEQAEVRMRDDKEPLGESDFGPVYEGSDFNGSRDMIDFLESKKGGEIINALYHSSVGGISLVWGNPGTAHSDGFGMSKIVKFHPEIRGYDLQALLDEMTETERTKNRVILENDKFLASVRLDWDGKKKTWLLTMFEKGSPSYDKTTDTAISPNPMGQSDTALLPEGLPLENKGTESTEDEQAKGSEQRFRRAERAGDVTGAAEAASDFMRNATPKNTTVDDVLRFLRVYHNSPHVLKKADGAFVDPETGERLGFDHRFMGSGEGAQAHGWGSYFSVKDLEGYASPSDIEVFNGMSVRQNEAYVISKGGSMLVASTLFLTIRDCCMRSSSAPNEKTIKKYVKEHLERSIQEEELSVRRDGRLLDALKDNEPWAVAAINPLQESTVTDPKTGYKYTSYSGYSIENVRGLYESAQRRVDSDKKALSFAESNPDYVKHFATKMQRHKYVVEIPDPKANHYIKEDRLVTKHEEEMIRKAINDKWELRDSVLEKRSWRGRKWKEAYELLSRGLGGEERASFLLNKAGFVGIHYNGQRDGECYVIFNEKDAKITDHYRFRRTTAEEREKIIERARADGSWLLAPDGTPSTLSEEGWIASRSSDFKAEYGDWGKARNAKWLISGEYISEMGYFEFPHVGETLIDDIAAYYLEEVEGHIERPGIGDILLDKTSVKNSYYHGVGANKITAFAVVPDVLKSGVQIDTQKKWKGRGYDTVMIAAPVSIDGEGYVCSVIVKQTTKNRFYLHELYLQKNLRENLSSLGGNDQDAITSRLDSSLHPDRIANVLKEYVSHKDDLPESFYQANGEPKREIVEEYLRAEEEKEVRYRRVKADPMNAISPINPQWDGEWYSPEDLTGKSTADLLELPAAPATPEKRPTQSVAEYAETMSRHYADPRVRFRTGSHKENLRAPQPPRITDGMSLYEVAQLQHEYNRNYRDFSEESMRRMGALDKYPEKFIRSQIDVARPVELFVEEMKRLGLEVSPEDNMYWSLMLQSSKELNMKKREVEPMFERYAETIREMNLDGSLEKVPSVSYVYMKDPNVKKSKSVVKDANGYEKASLYLQAKDIDECKKLGLPYRGEKGFEDLVTNKETGKKLSPEEYISLFENAVGKARAEGLCDQIRAISNWSTQKLYEAGLLTEDRYRELTRGSRRYYVPQRGFKITEETDRRAYELAELKAEGRQSLSADPVANLQAICNTTVIRAIRNKDLLDFYRWCKKNEQELYHRGVLEMGESYYRRTAEVDDKGRRVYLQSKKTPTLEEMRADNQTRREMAKIRMEKAALREKADRGLISSYTFEAKTKELDDRLKAKEDELIVKYRDPNLSLGDTDKTAKEERRVVRVYENGEERIIALSEDYSGKAVADALNNRSIGRYVDSDNLIAKIFRGWGTITRTLSSLRTQYSWAFAGKNAVRDMKAAVAANMGDFGWAYTQQFLRNVPKVQRAVWEYVWKDNFGDVGDLKSEYGQYMKEFFEDGAATGYSFLEPFNILHKNLKGIAEPTTWNNIVYGQKGEKKSLYAAMRMCAVLSEGSELSTRFAEYVTSRERGFSRKEAAIHAKEVTVNFNRHGAMSPYFNTLFGFWNASVQGAYRWYRIPLSFMAKVSAQLFVTGMLQAYLYLSDDDDKDFTEWDLMTNICIGDFRLPIPQNLRAFNGAGLQFMLACMGKKDWQAAVIDAAQFMAGEYLPSEAASLLNAVEWDETRGTLKDGGAQVWRDIAPTAISPMADVIANRNFMGQPVYKMPYVRSQDDNVAHWSLGKKRTKQVYKDFAEWQWKMRGGSTERNDLMSRKGTNQLSNSKLNNPSVIEHLVEGYGGGPISGLADIGTWIEFASTGDVKELKKLQMVAPFLRQERDYTATDVKYWELTDLYRSRQQTMSNLRKAKEGEDLERYREMTKRVSELAPRMTGEQLTEKIWEDGTQDEKLYVTWLETKALLKQIDKGTVTKEEVAPTIDRLTEQFRELR